MKFVIRHSSFDILTLLASLSAPALSTGCTVLSYKSPTGEHFTRSSLGSKTSIAHLTFEADTNGVRKWQLKGYDIDSSQSLCVVTDAAVKAAIRPFKP